MHYDMTVEVHNLNSTEVTKVDNIFSELVDVSISGWLATDQDNMHLYSTKIRFDAAPSLFAESFCKTIWDSIGRFAPVHLGLGLQTDPNITWFVFNQTNYDKKD